MKTVHNVNDLTETCIDCGIRFTHRQVMKELFKEQEHQIMEKESPYTPCMNNVSDQSPITRKD